MVDAILIRHVPVRRFVLRPANVDVLRPLWPKIETVDIEPPMRDELHEFDASYPWTEAAAQQEQQLERIREAQTSWPAAQLIYMGFAPIPLAFHLGTLLGQTAQVDIYNHQHDSHSWAWAKAAPTKGLIEPYRAPAGEPNSTKALLHRVSVSYRVKPEQTRALARGAHVYEIAVARPSPSVLRSPADLWAVAQAFKQTLDDSHNDFPHAPMRHLAASVPVGLALAMGMQVNPTIHLPLQTWKYLSAREHPYIPAIRIGEREGVPRVLLLGASPLDAGISAPQEVQEIHELLAGYDDRLRVVGRPAASVEDSVRMLDEADPTVLHVACHGERGLGSDAGYLKLLSSRGAELPVELEDLERLIGRLRRVRCLVFTACESAELARRLAERLPVVAIGFDGELYDEDSRSFARMFWRSLAERHSVAEAFADGRMGMGPRGRQQARLLHHPDIDPGTLVPFGF